MRRRLSAIVLAFVMCISMVPAYKSFAAENATFEVEATIFTKAEATDLRIQEGSGWFADVYEIEESDIKSVETLTDGIKKYKVAFDVECEDGDYREGESIRFSLIGVKSDAIKATVARNESGNLGVKLIFKEKNLLTKQHKVNLASDNGSTIQTDATQFSFTIKVNGVDTAVYVAKQNNGEYIFRESIDIDDNGNPVGNNLGDGNELVGQIINLGGNGANSEYKIVKASRNEDDYNLTLKKIELENRKVKVVLDTEMGLAVGPDFKFECAGKVIDKTVNPTEKYGPHEFDVLLENIPKGEDAKVSKLPDSMEYFYKIVDQQYDRDKDELRVKLGRNIAIIISDAKDGVKYDNFAIAHHESGFSFKIFDVKGEKLLGESENANVLGVGNVNFFYGLLPGDYIVRIDKVPNKFKDFDTSRDYKLRIAKDGKPTMEIFQEQGYAYANPYGGIDKPRFDDSIRAKMHSGTKTPFLLLINKKSQDKKVIVDNENNAELYQTQKNIGDEVEYKITRSISPDHNFVFRYDKYVNVGAKTDLSFEDALDKRLEYIDGSLYIKVDGKPSDEFEAEFDKNANKIVVRDKSKPDLVKFDFNTATKLPANKTLEVGFRAKVKNFGKENQSIYNSFGTTTEIALNIELKCNKKWYGGNELLKNLEPEKFIENFEVEGYFGGNKIATYNVKDYLKPGSIAQKESSKDFSFIVHKLPKYTESELKKPEEQRTPIEYRIVEKANILSSKFEKIVHNSNPLTINNVFKREKIDINIIKKWELLEDEKGKADSYTPVFTLTQSNGKNQEVKQYTFSKEKTELVDGNGEMFKYEIFEEFDGKIQKAEKTPSVSYEDGCYKIKDLPKTDLNGEEYFYEVKEEKILKNGKNVTDDFAVTGNKEKLAVDTATGEYSKTIINKQKPPIPENPPEPNTPPEPGKPHEEYNPKSPDTGDMGYRGILLFTMCVSVMTYSLYKVRSSKKIIE
ncbi:MAG: hypothetical protein SPH92_01080 [Anaerovoracaceae bacterium]|nr:hypothetical protein [Anaerovoracaceae bacterium]